MNGLNVRPSKGGGDGNVSGGISLRKFQWLKKRIINLCFRRQAFVELQDSLRNLDTS